MSWNPFRRRDNSIGLLNQVLNAATSALSGRDLFSFMWRSRQHTSDSSLKLSAVFCAVNLYTGSIGSLPRTVIRISPSGKPDRQLNTADHPAVKIFLHYANPDYSADAMLGDMIYDRLLDGNYYAIREFDSQGRTFRIYHVHPSRIPRGNIYYANGTEQLATGAVARKGTLIYRIETGSTKEDANPQYMLLPREYMVHIKSDIPDKPNHRGFGIIENAGRSFNMYENSEEYGVHFYKNGHKNQTYLTTENRLAPDVLKRVESFFESHPNAAMEDAFKTRILEQGLKPVNVAIPMQQLQFIETRAFSVEDVSRWFNVPPELLHSHMGSNGSSSDVGKLIHLFIQTGLHPFISSLGRQIRNELLPLSSQLQYSFEFNLIYLFRTIINEFSQALRNFFEIGVMDRTDICKLLGMQIDPADVNNALRYVPANLMTVDHSIALRDKALLANDMMDQQIRKLTLDNDNYMSPQETMELQQTKKEEEVKPPSDSLDKSPDDQNLDKKLRVAKNAFIAVVNGLQAYERKVFDQKQSKYSDVEEFKASMSEFYTDKFTHNLTSTFNEWADILPDVSPFTTVDELIDSWLDSPANNILSSEDGHTRFLKLIGSAQ